MVLSAKWSKNNPDGWGAMGGFLLIFFPPQNQSARKNALLSLAHSPSTGPPFSGRLLSKTLSTLSICSLLVFTTFLLFTLSTFEPSAAAALRHRPPRRVLLSHSIVKLFNPRRALQNGAGKDNNETSAPASFKALQGMGILYRRGTRAMPDLIVAHVSHAVAETEFLIFLRILHLTGLLARSDLAFVFSSSSISSKFTPMIRQENESLLKLVSRYDEFNGTSHNSRGLAGLARYLRTRKDEKKESKESIWGKGFRPTNHSESDESTRPSYGSVVGFDASELDPANSLSGFFDHVPMSLRRWACYPMLLGRLRRSYKHVLLADVERVLLLNDPFTRVRNRSPESVYFWTHHDSEPGKRVKKQTPKSEHGATILPGIVAGGSRGIRRLSDAVLTEIVRAALEHKSRGKNAVTESGIVSQLVRGGHVLRNVHVIGSEERAPDAGEVFGSDPNAASVYGTAVVMNRGSGINVKMRDLLWCWSDLHSEVYRDCLDTQ